MRWRARTPPPKSAANSFERLPPDSPQRWRALLGRKISLRYALTGDPEHPFSEAIGVISAVTGGDDDPTIEVITRRGTSVAIRAADVLAGKVFP